MTLLRGAHNIVGECIEFLAHGLELRSCAIGKRLRCQTLTRSSLLHFQAMLVHSGDEKNVPPVQSMETRNGIGRDTLIGVSDMRRAIGVGNGSGDVEGLARSHKNPCRSAETARSGASGARRSSEIGENRQDERPSVEVKRLSFAR